MGTHLTIMSWLPTSYNHLSLDRKYDSLTTRKWDEQGRPGNALWDAPVCQLEQEARHRHPGRRHQNCLSRTGRNAPHCHLLRSHQNRIVTKVNKYLSANTFSVILLRTSPQSSKSCIQDRREFATIWKTRTGPRSTWDDIDTHRGERETDCQNGPTCPSYPKQKPALQTHTTQRWHLLPFYDENMWWKFKICYFLLHYNLWA